MSVFSSKLEALESGKDKLQQEVVTAGEALNAGIRISADGRGRNCYELLSFADVGFPDIVALRPEFEDIAAPIGQQLKNDSLYAQYIARQARDVESLRRDEAHSIPADFDYSSLNGLSNELRHKLSRVRPQTLGQAGRVEGMTPAALTLILAKLRQSMRKQA